MDTVSEKRRSENMRHIRSKDMKPEMIVRRLVHRMGYRYRLHGRELPGKPDLVFRPRRAVIFVHGCFWHQHDDPECNIARMPKSRLDYWEPKLSRNKARDRQHHAELVSCGWQVLTVWECQTKQAKLSELAEIVRSFLDEQS